MRQYKNVKMFLHLWRSYDIISYHITSDGEDWCERETYWWFTCVLLLEMLIVRNDAINQLLLWHGQTRYGRDEPAVTCSHVTVTSTNHSTWLNITETGCWPLQISNEPFQQTAHGLWSSAGSTGIYKHSLWWPRPINPINLVRLSEFLVCDHGSPVSLCMPDYKSICVAVMMWATLVNTQTHRHSGATRVGVTQGGNWGWHPYFFLKKMTTSLVITVCSSVSSPKKLTTFFLLFCSSLSLSLILLGCHPAPFFTCPTLCFHYFL